MIAVDTNVLIYAHNPADPLHGPALAALRWLRDSGHGWAVPLPCLIEFHRLATHPNVLGRPLEVALAAAAGIVAAPGCRLVALDGDGWSAFVDVARDARATGNLSFDAHVVAACRSAGVRAILSEDRDMRRFHGITALTLADDWRAAA